MIFKGKLNTPIYKIPCEYNPHTDNLYIEFIVGWKIVSKLLTYLITKYQVGIIFKKPDALKIEEIRKDGFKPSLTANKQ